MPNPTIILHKIQPHSILRKQGNAARIPKPRAGGILDVLLYLAIQRCVPLVVPLSVGIGERVASFIVPGLIGAGFGLAREVVLVEVVECEVFGAVGD
jgi:hypothetical protein